MTQETIVAAFDTVSHAQAAAQDLEASGISASQIKVHSDTSFVEGTGPVGALSDSEPVRKEPGFWAKLFGTDDDMHSTYGAHTPDHAVYDRTMSGGGSVLTVKILDVEQDAERVLNILDNHNPIDLEERMATYGEASPSAAYTETLAGAGKTNIPPAAAAALGSNETIQLAEEELQVGKRVVNRGTTRIRRYVVETPVSEDVSLHREDVSVERRPVSSTAAVGSDAFTDKTIEVTEMNEEAVIGKTAHVVEEVVIRKDVSDRVETVRDTVRREEVEVEKVDGTGSKTGI